MLLIGTTFGTFDQRSKGWDTIFIIDGFLGVILYNWKPSMMFFLNFFVQRIFENFNFRLVIFLNSCKKVFSILIGYFLIRPFLDKNLESSKIFDLFYPIFLQVIRIVW